jgi:hypothetical protein
VWDVSEGYHVISVTARNSFSSASASLNCTVEIPVAGLSLELNSYVQPGAYYVQLGNSTTFLAIVSQGSSLRYDWNFDDVVLYKDEGTVLGVGPFIGWQNARRPVRVLPVNMKGLESHQVLFGSVVSFTESCSVVTVRQCHFESND